MAAFMKFKGAGIEIALASAATVRMGLALATKQGAYKKACSRHPLESESKSESSSMLVEKLINIIK